MTIRQHGGVFGRNPTFQSVNIDGDLNAESIDLKDALPAIVVNSTDGSATPRGIDIQINGTTIASFKTNPSTGVLEIASGFSGWGGVVRFLTNGNSVADFTSGGFLGFPAGRGLSLGGAVVISNVGSPEGVVTAPPGSIYTNQSGGAGTTLYVKESGTGNTGWVAK